MIFLIVIGFIAGFLFVVFLGILGIIFGATTSSNTNNSKVETKNTHKKNNSIFSSAPKKPEVNEKLEKEMNIYGLTPEEKEVCRQGYYEPYRFEEEDLEEDDYYDDTD